MTRISHVVIALLLLLPLALARAADVEVRAGFEVEDALLGDTVGFTILVEGTDEVTPPEVDSFGNDFDVHFLGGRPSRRTSIVTVDGRTTRREELSYALLYELRPRRSGQLAVPSLVLQAAGEAHHTPPRELRVIGPEKTPYAQLELSFTPRRVYIEQPVDIVLTIRVQRAQMPGGWYEGDPWLPGRPLQLRVPWFEGLDGFATGDYDAFRRSLLAQPGQNGFHVNGEAQATVFGDGRALRFALPRESVIRDGRAYNEYTLRKTFVPLAAGSAALPVSTLTGELATVLQQARGQLEVKETEEVFVAHEPAVLDVLPVPEEGRPPTYTHAVGRFEAQADVDPRRVKVGDPMTLVLRVRGRGLLDRVAAPALSAQASLAGAFQVAEADPPRTEGGWRVFTYLLRPRDAGVAEVPPLEIASFDPESESFDVTRTEPIGITVEEARAVQASEVVVAGGGAAASTPGEELVGGLLGNYGIEAARGDDSYDPAAAPAVWALLVLPPLVLLGVLAVARRRDRLAGDPAARRRRGALARALGSVERGREALTEQRREDAAAGLHTALAGYVADRTGRPAAGMTAADVEAAFAARGVDAPAAAEVVSALRDAEAARFGGSAAPVADALDAAPGWLQALEREPLS